MKKMQKLYECMIVLGTLAACIDLWVALSYADSRQTMAQANLTIIILVAIFGWLFMVFGARRLIYDFYVASSLDELAKSAQAKTDYYNFVEDTIHKNDEEREEREKSIKEKTNFTWITLNPDTFGKKRGN